jgi:simple sugar transport system ATP-binding protein
MTDAAALEVQNLGKAYGPVRALSDVSLTLRRGEVLGLLGDNGAGKSTLVKCICGNEMPDEGAFLMNGEPVRIDSPQAARTLGIETVHQDLALVPALNVAENLFLNRELVAGRSVLKSIGWLRKRQMYAQSRQILNELHVTLPSVRLTVDRLSGGQRQAVAVGRAAAWGSHIVIMDEPSAALGVEQAKNVRELIGQLASRGIAVLLITHNMQEAIEVCDHAIVLRHGRKVGDVDTSAVTARDLVDMITGASLRHGVEDAEL